MDHPARWIRGGSISGGSNRKVYDNAINNFPPQNRFRSGVASRQYRHAIEHDAARFIAFSRNKLQTELLRVPVAIIDAVLTHQTK
jgi:hypothetical protein